MNAGMHSWRVLQPAPWYLLQQHRCYQILGMNVGWYIVVVPIDYKVPNSIS